MMNRSLVKSRQLPQLVMEKLWLLEFMSGTFCVWPSWCTSINSWMKPLLEQGALGLDTNLEIYWTLTTTINLENHLIWFARTFWVSYPRCCRGHATMPVGPCRPSRYKPSRWKRSGCDSMGCWNWLWLGTPFKNSHPTIFLDVNLSKDRFRGCGFENRGSMVTSIHKFNKK